MRVVLGIQPISPPAPRIINHARWTSYRPTCNQVVFNQGKIFPIKGIGPHFIKIDDWSFVGSTLDDVGGVSRHSLTRVLKESSQKEVYFTSKALP